MRILINPTHATPRMLIIAGIFSLHSVLEGKEPQVETLREWSDKLTLLETDRYINSDAAFQHTVRDNGDNWIRLDTSDGWLKLNGAWQIAQLVNTYPEARQPKALNQLAEMMRVYPQAALIGAALVVECITAFVHHGDLKLVKLRLDELEWNRQINENLRQMIEQLRDEMMQNSNK